jgi:outer membrane PBP1 activator LpoA protein
VLLDQAKNLTSNQKYQEALGTLTQLYATKLTPEQKQQADDLKAQIQTAVSQKAASTLGNFLGGKK